MDSWKFRFQHVLRRTRTKTMVRVSLVRLDLKEATALAEAIQGNALLTSLDFRQSNFGAIIKKGGVLQVETLAAGLKGSNVEALDLTETGLGKEGVQAFGAILKHCPVQSLNLAGNTLGVQAGQALACALHTSKLTSLNLSNNWLRDEGVAALAAALRDSPLASLQLHCNSSGAEGACALAASLSKSSMTSLDLSGNFIGQRGAEALLDILGDSPVIELLLENYAVKDQTLRQIQGLLDSNIARCFVLQMEVKKLENELELKFRTFAGTVAAVLTWSMELPIQGLPAAVWAVMQTSGFQLPSKGLRALNLRLVCPGGSLLDVGPTAAPLIQQLGILTEPSETLRSKRPQDGTSSTAAPSKRPR